MSSKTVQTEIEALQVKLTALKTIEALVSSLDIPKPKHIVWLNLPIAKYSLVYEAFNLDQAREIIGGIWNSSVDVLSLSLCKDVFVSFRTPYHGRSGEITPVFPVTVDVSKWRIDFKFYALIGDDIVSVSIEINTGFKGYAQVRYTQKQNWHHVKYVSLDAPAFKGFDYIRWASGSPTTPPSFTLYWRNASSLEEIFS